MIKDKGLVLAGMQFWDCILVRKRLKVTLVSRYARYWAEIDNKTKGATRCSIRLVIPDWIYGEMKI